ncbi:MAG: UDP-N-acetylmuramoyl-L-alanine--D-glutamate ligase [Erysipelotrichaceae bacterium]|nr:UDP-N-acetylmuramoyl-L-alanine--D-glutamate ligase [Erysipelotrichaceae bacterium]
MLSGKKVLVLGLARSGQAAVNLLLKLHATITVNEFAPKNKIACYDDYVSKGIEMITGGHPDELFERDFDFVVKNPGINYHKPFILRLKERGIPVYTEIELAYQVAKMQNYIAITGTNGKTTTVSLIYQILKDACHHTCLAGNVGIPYSSCVLMDDLLENGNYDVVLEMSNFQLLDIEKFHPHIAAIINLTPDHLDYMASLDEYYASKTNIYMNQNENDYYLENIDDLTLQEYIQKYPVKAKRYTFSLKTNADCMIKDGAIYFLNQHVIDIDEIKIVGKHNIQNMMIAIMSTYLSGVSIKQIHDTLASFTGVEHRIEFVKEINGVKYYNDSKATNTDASIIALKAFDKPVILLMGGYEKGLDLTEMTTYNDHIQTLICFGEAKDRFAKDMHHKNTYIVDNLAAAIHKAYDIAKKDDIVLLSPSTSSFDEFSGYEQRGSVFKDIVNHL